MHAAKSTRQIHSFCGLGATAVAAGSGYDISDSTMRTSMLAYVVSEGRLFALKPSEWSLLLGGVTLCGLLALLF
jgi:hypothetical protein